MTASQILDIFNSEDENSKVGQWMSSFCNKPNGPDLNSKYIEGLKYSYRNVPDPLSIEPDVVGAKIVHYFTIECVHGWLSRKWFTDLALDLAIAPDALIAEELKHSLESIHGTCEPCGLI